MRSVDDHLALAADDLETATTLLSARPLAGDDELASGLITESRGRWRKNGRRWLDALRSRVVERREQAGDVAYLLEPDLKDGHGGLRDVQTVWWAGDADLLVPDEDLGVLGRCYDRLLDVRVALHRVTGPAGDVLRLEDQDAVAAAAGAGSADDLMADVVRRRPLDRVDRRRRLAPPAPATRSGGRSASRPGVVVSDRVVELADQADVAGDPTVVLRLARVAAQRDVPIGRSTLDRLAEEIDPADWAAALAARRARASSSACSARGTGRSTCSSRWTRRACSCGCCPSGRRVRSRPQRNAYHRFTVDRHLWEAAANAAALTDRVRRPDLLVLGALFHDLGKGSPGDHTVAGMDAGRADRAPHSASTPPTSTRSCASSSTTSSCPTSPCAATSATRRRSASSATPSATSTRSHLLHALTEADSLATGPSAWGSWKEQLVAELVERTADTLDGADLARRGRRGALVPRRGHAGRDGAAARSSVRSSPTRTTTPTAPSGSPSSSPDRPGTFARVAGALSLRGLDVLTAWAYSGDVGAGPMAASRFRVMPPRPGLDWEPIVDDLRRAARR